MATTRYETLEPEDLARLGSLYDAAWAAVAPGLQHLSAAAMQAARARLAGIMLELTRQQSVHDNLKQRALVIFHYTPHFAAKAQGDGAASDSSLPAVSPAARTRLPLK